MIDFHFFGMMIIITKCKNGSLYNKVTIKSFLYNVQVNIEGTKWYRDWQCCLLCTVYIYIFQYFSAQRFTVHKNMYRKIVLQALFSLSLSRFVHA